MSFCLRLLWLFRPSGHTVDHSISYRRSALTMWPDHPNVSSCYFEKMACKRANGMLDTWVCCKAIFRKTTSGTLCPPRFHARFHLCLSTANRSFRCVYVGMSRRHLPRSVKVSITDRASTHCYSQGSVLRIDDENISEYWVETATVMFRYIYSSKWNGTVSELVLWKFTWAHGRALLRGEDKGQVPTDSCTISWHRVGFTVDIFLSYIICLGNYLTSSDQGAVTIRVCFVRRNLEDCSP
jgi:hypothetical protein